MGTVVLVDLVTVVGQGGEDALNERAMSALTFVGLGTRANELISSFSYGHQRLIEIARALAANPALLLLDEPAAGLNDHEAAELARLIRMVADDWNIGVLLVEHKVDLVTSISDTITVLESGRVLAAGTPREVVASQAVIDAYLGSSAPIEQTEDEVAGGVGSVA